MYIYTRETLAINISIFPRTRTYCPSLKKYTSLHNIT